MSGELILVLGGSGSGKSAWAERTLLERARGRAVYLATMENAGEEAAARIERHRAMRARHGAAAGRRFVTVERPVDIGGAPVRPGDWVLLEDLGNLLANEIWSPQGAGERAVERILEGIGSLLDRASLLVVVSGDVFGDGGGYDPETAQYIRRLGELHRALIAMGGELVEIVCGIAVEPQKTVVFSPAVDYNTE